MNETSASGSRDGQTDGAPSASSGTADEPDLASSPWPRTGAPRRAAGAVTPFQTRVHELDSGTFVVSELTRIKNDVSGILASSRNNVLPLTPALDRSLRAIAMRLLALANLTGEDYGMPVYGPPPGPAADIPPPYWNPSVIRAPSPPVPLPAGSQQLHPPASPRSQADAASMPALIPSGPSASLLVPESVPVPVPATGPVVSSRKRPRECAACRTRDTPEWRRGPDGSNSLCNACGLHYSKIVRRDASTRKRQHTVTLADYLHDDDIAAPVPPLQPDQAATAMPTQPSGSETSAAAATAAAAATVPPAASSTGVSAVPTTAAATSSTTAAAAVDAAATDQLTVSGKIRDPTVPSSSSTSHFPTNRASVSPARSHATSASSSSPSTSSTAARRRLG